MTEEISTNATGLETMENGATPEEFLSMTDAFNKAMANEVMTSFEVGDSKEEKLKLYNMKNNCENRLLDYLNTPITMTGFLAHFVPTRNEATGKIEIAPRIVIFDENDVGYACVSLGVFNAMKNIVVDLWKPTKDDPIIVMPKRVKGKGKFEFTTLEVQGM